MLPPSKISAMLCQSCEKSFTRPDWIYEPKWDGERCIAFCKEGKVRLQSRRFKNLTGRYPELKEIKRCLLAKQAILDGEVIALDEKEIPRFHVLQNRIGLTDPKDIRQEMKRTPVFYMVFDVLFLNGKNLMDKPLQERKKILSQILTEGKHIKLTKVIPAAQNGIVAFKGIKKIGMEGIIAKHKMSPYLPGTRSRYWLKIKTFNCQEFVICGYTRGTGYRKEFFGSLILGIYSSQKKLTFVGHVGTGFNQRDIALLLKHMKKLKTSRCPFEVPPKTNRPAQWILPQLICQVKFLEWTKEGKLRVPVYQGLRFDKKPEECKRE